MFSVAVPGYFRLFPAISGFSAPEIDFRVPRAVMDFLLGVGGVSRRGQAGIMLV
jgi:hypothetical protein